jgi:DNA-binding ferritin-like protein
MILEPTNVRQRNHWECGACASMSAASLFGVGPQDLDDWVELLGTNEARSTSPQAIVEAFRGFGCQVEERQGMTAADLAGYVAAGRAVICPVQDYTGIRSKKASWEYGHWVVAIGVLDRYVVIQDSSIQNALGIPGGDVPADEAADVGNLAAPGRVLVYRDKSVLPPDQPDALTWMENWQDVGEDGTEYICYGIVIGPPADEDEETKNEEKKMQSQTLPESLSHRPPKELLRVPVLSGQGARVDREAVNCFGAKGVIYGCIIAQLGPFKSEGRGEFDQKALDLIQNLTAAAPNGAKSRLAHPDESHDGVDKTLGRLRDPRMDTVGVRDAEGTLKTDTIPCVRADLHINPAADKGPFKMGDYVMTLAETDPDLFSSSLVLTSDREYRLNPDGTRQRDADGNELPPLWRPTAIMACDIVSTGDAVDGLLSKCGGTVENLSSLPNGVVFAAAAALDKQFAGKPREYVEQHCRDFLGRYLDRRYGKQGLGDGGQGSGDGGDRRGALQTVLAVLRAQTWLYHTLHWQAQGPAGYSLHLLFERLYYRGPEQYDALGEKLVALYGVEAVDPVVQARLAIADVAAWSGIEGRINQALAAEKDLAAAIDTALKLSADDGGLQNYLQGVLDDHQTNVYLLQQVLPKAESGEGKAEPSAFSSPLSALTSRLKGGWTLAGLAAWIKRNKLNDPNWAIGGEDEPGSPDAPEHRDDNPYPEGPQNVLHDGCRSAHGLHLVTRCRKCNAEIAEKSCGCQHRDYESRVVLMAKEPCAACQLEAPGATKGGEADAGQNPENPGDVMPADQDLSAELDLYKASFAMMTF